MRPFIRMPIRFMSAIDQEIASDVGVANAGTGVAVQIQRIRSTRDGLTTVFSQSQMRYIQDKLRRGSFNKDISGNGGQLDTLFESLQQSDTSYVSLFEKLETTNKSVLFNESVMYPRQSVEISPATALLDGEDAENAIDDASKMRQLREVAHNQEMMVGLAFATPFELRQFRTIPYVLHIDATADTNQENRPLVIVGAKDSNGKMFVVLRAFLPNERAWSYRWLFQTAVPLLLGADHLANVRALVSDGDSQEIVQLNGALDKFFPNAQRLRCSWHIVDRGWARWVKFSLGGHSQSQRKAHLKGKQRKKATPLTFAHKLSRVLYRWIYSWAEPGYCETEEEFRLSYALFVKFLDSSLVNETLPTGAALIIKEFVRGRVIPHTEHFCHYTRHGLLCFGSHTNCGLEGLNNGTKNSATGVRPNTTLDKAVTVLRNDERVSTEQGNSIPINDWESAFAKLKHQCADTTKAIDCLRNEKRQQLTEKCQQFLQGLYHEAVAEARKERNDTAPDGRRVSMLPAYSKKRKSHGTSHY